VGRPPRRPRRGFEGGFFEEDLPFGRFGYTSSVVEQADWGVVVDGSTGEGVLEYELGVGVGEGYSLYGDTRDSPRATARFVARPLASSGLALAVPGAALPLGGLFAGFGAAWSPEYRGDFTVVTPMRNELFQVKDLRAEEARFFHATAGWDVGPVRLVYETIFGEVFEQWFGSGSGFFDVDTPTGKQDFDEVGTWEAGISWAVTGQHYDSRAMAKETAGGFVPSEPKYRGGKKSRRGDGDDDEDDGFEDVVELWFRYSNADIDRAFFDAGLADFDVSSQEFRTAAFGAHWRPSRNVRLSAGVARTIADQTPAQFGGDDRDTSAFLSLSYRF